jgi:Cu/Ag efflux protein CusF
MSGVLRALPLLAALAVAVTSSGIARIHGRVTAIDAKRGVFRIHHDPFRLMPMSMTMEVRPKRPADLRRIRVGEVIDVTIDTSIVPWPGTDIVKKRS